MSSRPVVLAVDDELVIHETLTVLFEDRYEFHSALDARTGLEIIQARPVDVLLLDMRMPGVCGLAVLEQLGARERRPDVIVVTAMNDLQTAIAAMKLGADEYVTKPFDPGHLVALIDQMLHQRSTRDNEPTTRAALLIGDDIPARAALALALRRDPRVVVSSAPPGVPEWRLGRSPDVIVVDVASTTLDRARVIAALREGHPGSAVVTPTRPLAFTDLCNELARILARHNRSPKPPLMSALVGQVFEHVSRDVQHATVEAIADALRLSPRQLWTRFSEETGMTVRDFLVRMRVETTRCLLREADDKLEAIAERAGYYSASHLSVAFSQHTGYTPGEYRRTFALPRR